MGFELTDEAGEKIYRQEFVTENFDKETFRADAFEVPLPFGTVTVKQWTFDGIRMTHTDAVLGKPVELDWKGDSEIVTMHFNLQGKVSLQDNALSPVFELSTNQHNIFYGTDAKGTMKVDELRMKMFLIQLTRPAFFAIAGGGNDAIKRFAGAVSAGRPAVFSGSNLSINLSMQSCINTVLSCSYADSLKRLFFFSKTIELLVLQAESFDRAARKRDVVLKTDYDKERILFARDYLLRHIEKPPTLTELSRIAGLNEYKLKRGFKEMFDITVFGYLSEVRLELAKVDLLEGKKTATEIAFELGYSSLQHFSAAFKKKFGVSPKGS